MKIRIIKRVRTTDSDYLCIDYQKYKEGHRFLEALSSVGRSHTKNGSILLIDRENIHQIIN